MAGLFEPVPEDPLVGFLELQLTVPLKNDWMGKKLMKWQGIGPVERLGIEMDECLKTELLESLKK